MSRLVVVSNRIALPDDKKSSAGGLAVGILGALKAAGGLWFGWSGEIGDDQQPLKQVSRGNISWASFNLNERDHDEYYNQFSNAVLWPAFHYRLDLVSFQREAWEGYLRVNAMLADKLLPLIEPDDTLWIHDYHLLPFASELRKRGVNNRIGFFLHIPFPTPEIFNRRMPSCWSNCAITICWASRPKATELPFLTALPCRPDSPISGTNAIRHGVRRSVPRFIRLGSIRTKLRATPKARCRRSWPS